MHINGVITLLLNETDPRTGKPVVTIMGVDIEGKRVTMILTTNIGEMIGGASTGARKRWEDQRGMN